LVHQNSAIPYSSVDKVYIDHKPLRPGANSEEWMDSRRTERAAQIEEQIVEQHCIGAGRVVHDTQFC
jgi:hypothetical protein